MYVNAAYRLHLFLLNIYSVSKIGRICCIKCESRGTNGCPGEIKYSCWERVHSFVIITFTHHHYIYSPSLYLLMTITLIHHHYIYSLSLCVRVWTCLHITSTSPHSKLPGKQGHRQGSTISICLWQVISAHSRFYPPLPYLFSIILYQVSCDFDIHLCPEGFHFQATKVWIILCILNTCCNHFHLSLLPNFIIEVVDVFPLDNLGISTLCVSAVSVGIWF